MPGDAGDGGVGVVEKGCQQRVEAVGIGVDVAVGFVEFETGAPELLGLVALIVRKGFLFVLQM